MLLATLHPTPPYRFDLLLDVLARFPHPSVDVTREDAYWRVIGLETGLALVRIVSIDDVLEAHLVASSGDITPESVLAVLRRILPLNSTLADFYACATQHDNLWRVVEPLAGMPETRTETAFEALAQAIIEQQIAWAAAQRAQRWLVEWAGRRLTHRGIDHYAFPTPTQIAAASIDDLKPLKITFKRIALLIDLAGRGATGELDLEGLAEMSPHAAYDELLRLKGIGHWTAAVTLARAFGHQQVAHNDVALQAAVNRYFYGGKGRIPAQQVIDTFAPFGAFAGHAAHHTLLRWVLDEYPIRSPG